MIILECIYNNRNLEKNNFMKDYLILQYPYEFTEIALCQKGNVIDSIQEDKFNAVKMTVPNIQIILDRNNITLQDIEFIGVNTGPGPYNTLRALITTTNGIHFVNKKPLVSLSAIDLLLHEYNTQPALAVLNAFAGHVFYGFNTPNKKEQGYCSLDNLIQKINKQSEQLLLVGNGVELHSKKLLHDAKDKVIIPSKIPAFNSLEILALEAYQAYSNKKIEQSYLKPKYLQSPAIKN